MKTDVHFLSYLVRFFLKLKVFRTNIVGNIKTHMCTHASQVTMCSHNTDNVLYGLYVSTFNQVCNF